MSDEEVAQIVRNVNAVEVDFTSPIDLNALLLELQACRKTGFAFSMDSVTPGSSVIASKLPDYVGASALAIGIGIHTSELEESRESVMSLISESLAQYFPENPPSHSKSRAAKVPQGGYLVSKKASP
jgi:DNA-binding IclR family transcriptional regulator